jgi:hypothetical protein
MPFRNYKEKIAGFKKLDKEIEVHFGVPSGYQLSYEYYNYLDNYDYENKLSDLSGTVMEFVDPESLIEETIRYVEQFNFKDNYLYMGSCEMFFYFYTYVPDGNKTDDELDKTNKYLAIDHETGDIEYQTSILDVWMKDFIGFEP